MSIKQLSFDRFIDASEGDLSVLGKAPEEVLREVMEDLQSQFSEAIGGESAVIMVGRMAEVEDIRLKLVRIQTLVDAMQEFPSEVLTEQLRQEGFNFKFEDVEADLKRVITRAKNLTVQLAIKEKQIEEQNRGSGEDISVREAYTLALGALSKEAGYRIKANDITTYDFCIEYRKMVEKSRKHGRADK